MLVSLQSLSSSIQALKISSKARLEPRLEWALFIRTRKQERLVYDLKVEQVGKRRFQTLIRTYKHSIKAGLRWHNSWTGWDRQEKPTAELLPSNFISIRKAIKTTLNIGDYLSLVWIWPSLMSSPLVLSHLLESKFKSAKKWLLWKTLALTQTKTIFLRAGSKPLSARPLTNKCRPKDS